MQGTLLNFRVYHSVSYKDTLPNFQKKISSLQKWSPFEFLYSAQFSSVSYQDTLPNFQKKISSLQKWSPFEFLCRHSAAWVNNFSSKTTRPRDVLFFLKDTLSIEDENLFKACKSVCSSVC